MMGWILRRMTTDAMPATGKWIRELGFILAEIALAIWLMPVEYVQVKRVSEKPQIAVNFPSNRSDTNSR